MNTFFSNQWFIFSLRFTVGALFVYAGATKVANPQAFADSIATFQLMPTPLINLLALGLPPFEVALGVMLITGWQVRPATFSVLVLSMVFAVALGQALIRGLEVDCGCFGSGEPSVLKTWASLGRDLLLMAAAAWIYRSCLNEITSPGKSAQAIREPEVP